MNWYGTLPVRWEEKRIGAVLEQRKEKNDPVKTDFILSLSAAHGVVPFSERKEKGGNKPKEELSRYAIAHDGDLLVNCMNVLSGSSGLSHWYGAISPVYYALYPQTDEVSIQFYTYIFRLSVFYKSLIGLGKGILMHESKNGAWNTIRLRIGMPDLKNVLVPFPERREQDQIVRWLGWHGSRINKLVRSKRREIECLKELKKAVISKAVTQGLDADGDMKDSGVKWLGSVPAHWGVSTVKKHFRIKKEIAGKEGYDVLSITQHGLKVKNVKSNEGQIAQDYSGYQFVHPGDFAMNHMDLITGYVDYSTLFGVTSPDYRVFQLRDESKDYPHYFLRLLQNCYHRRIFYAFGRGAAEKGRWRLPKENFEAFDIPIPPREEQEAIAAYLDKKCDEIDGLIAKVAEEIALVEEYKTRIISDAVTGKVDLRDVEIPDYEAVEEESSIKSEDEETEEDTGYDEN